MEQLANNGVVLTKDREIEDIEVDTSKSDILENTKEEEELKI